MSAWRNLRGICKMSININLVAMKFVSAEVAVGLIKSGDSVFIQGITSIPDTLVAAMTRRYAELRGVNLYAAFAVDKGVAPYACEEMADAFIVNSFFVGANVREHIARGYGRYIPALLGEIPTFFRQGIVPLDVALLNVSPPDKHGYCSTGVSVDITRGAVDSAKILIAQVNSHQPRTFNDALIHVSRFDVMVEANDPLTELPPIISSEIDVNIGRHIAAMIPDGATLQIGVGGIPNAVMSQLHSHKHLGLHTEAITEGAVELIKRGVIDNSRKKILPHFSVASMAVGTRRLYDFIDNYPQLQMLDVAYTNNPQIIAQNPDVRTVNSAIEVDLTGQIVSDSIGERVFSGAGGQHDFMCGGAICHSGKTFIALPSTTSRGETKIVENITCGGGVVSTRAQAQYIVTEYGIAELRAKSLPERARALINIAHPNHREVLERAARARFGRSFK